MGCRYSQLLAQLITLGRQWRRVDNKNPRLGFLWHTVTGPAAHAAVNEMARPAAEFDGAQLAGLKKAVGGVDAYEQRIEQLRKQYNSGGNKVWRGHSAWTPPRRSVGSNDAVLRGFKW